jgi:hypothetical protein
MDVMTAAAARPAAAGGIRLTALPSNRLATLGKLAVLAAFAGWLLFLGRTHEPFFDEAQAWLIARDNGPIGIVAHVARYEGTPALWHLLLWGLIRLGLPFGQLHLVSTACAVTGAAIILWRSPFPIALRIAIIGSYFFAYQFAVVARSYSLDLVLMPLLACFFADRTARPIRYALVVGLIANANTHGFLAAACFGVEWMAALFMAGKIAERRSLAALLCAGALGMIALATAWQPADNIFLQTFPPPRHGIGVAIYYLGEALIDRPDPFGALLPSVAEILRGFLLSLMVLAPCFLLFRRAGHVGLAAGLFGLLTAFSVWKYAYGWHAGLLFLIWLVLLWISWPATRADKGLRRLVIAAMCAVLIPQAIEGARTSSNEIHHAFSAGPEVATDVATWRRQHPAGRIAAFGFSVFAVQPWFSANIFANYHGGAGRPSYVQWNRDEPWKATIGDADWRQMIAHKPDMVILTLAALTDQRKASFGRSACGAGPVSVRTYPASALWKGYVLAEDTFVTLRCTDGPAAEQQGQA